MSAIDAGVAAAYDGASAAALARRLALPLVDAHESIGSTMDRAHALAADAAPAGTLVLADRQTAGRGRAGRTWASAPGAGIWMTLVERPADASSVEVLSLRLGLAAAGVLDAFAAVRVRLKWPNDLFVDGRKLAGILVEARWRDARPEWVAIGFGLNVLAPAGVPLGTGLRPRVDRLSVLEALLPALRRAAARRGALDDAELAEWATRDLARGRRCVSPGVGVVRGISAAGELVVDTPAGERAHRGGSLVFAEDA